MCRQHLARRRGGQQATGHDRERPFAAAVLANQRITLASGRGASGSDLAFTAPTYTAGTEPVRATVLGASVPYSLYTHYPAARFPDLTRYWSVTNELVAVPEGAVPLLYDPAQPARIDLPVRPGLATLVGAGLLGLGIVQLLR